jgi:serine phosphatase RsbU (regulator of sigma subunit)
MQTTGQSLQDPGGAPAARRAGDWLRRLPAQLAPLRGRPVTVALAGIVAEILFAVLLGHANHSDILGVAGAQAVLVGLVVAVLAGPWAGFAATATGAVAFWYFVSDHGETAPTVATVFGAVLWTASVVVAGVVADELRAQIVARRRADAASAALHRRLEGALLPTVPASLDGYRVTTFYRPGEERLGLGGDFYDCQVIDDGSLALLLGDVSGHGPHSAALGASLRAAWRGLMRAGVDPQPLLTALERVTQDEAAEEDLFATVWMGSVHPSGTLLTMGSLGHPAPLLLTGDVRYLECRPGPPLGVVPDPQWSPEDVPLPAEWTIVLYTDGLVEGRAAPGGDERFGPERLRAWFAAHRGSPVDRDTLAALLSTLEAANGGPLPDDVAVLCVTRAPDGRQTGDRRAPGAAEGAHVLK